MVELFSHWECILRFGLESAVFCSFELWCFGLIDYVIFPWIIAVGFLMPMPLCMHLLRPVSETFFSPLPQLFYFFFKFIIKSIICFALIKFQGMTLFFFNFYKEKPIFGIAQLYSVHHQFRGFYSTCHFYLIQNSLQYAFSTQRTCEKKMTKIGLAIATGKRFSSKKPIKSNWYPINMYIVDIHSVIQSFWLKRTMRASILFNRG